MISITIIFYKHAICRKINDFIYSYKIIKHIILL